MKAGASKRTIRIAVVESDPLRFIGLKSLFDTETDLELVSCSLRNWVRAKILTSFCWEQGRDKTCLT